MENNNKINYLKDFIKIWKLIGSNRKIFIIAILLTFLKTVFSIAASIGAGLVLQDSFVRISNPSDFIVPGIYETDVVKQAFIDLLIRSSLILLAYILYGVIYFIVNKLVIKTSYSLGSFVRSLLFFKINKIPYSLIENKMSGELLSRTTLDANTLALNFAFAMGNVFTMPTIVICTLIAMFIISPYLTLLSLVFIIAGILTSFIFSKLSAPKFLKKQTSLGDLNALIEQDIENRKVIKMFDLYEKNYDIYMKKSIKENVYNKKAEMLIGMVWPSNELFQYILSSFIYLVGIIFSYYNLPSGSLVFPKMEVGLVTSFSLLMFFLMGELANSLKLVGVVQKIFISFQRVNEVLEYPEIQDDGNIEVQSQGIIKFENVTFGYQEDKNVLSNLSFEIKQNQKIAIVGPTGSGKTTIINLLSRFYEINKGTIYIDGQDIKTIKRSSLMENISIVPQDSFLFSQSIYENIRYGNKKATYEDVVNAAKLANIDYFISQLKDGYNTEVNEDLDFSQGQLQLLSIARAILSKSKILILDEATSYVDSKTEKDIQNAIVHASKNKTVIMIAHRLSTIIDADKIIVIKDGNIEEIGNHKELLKNKGFYYQLYKSNYVNE